MALEMSKKALVVVAIGAGMLSLVGIIRGCACSGTRAPEELSDESKHWINLITFQSYLCPHCGKQVDLTDEQQRLSKPPELVCPHCGKKVPLAEAKAVKPAKSAPRPGSPRRRPAPTYGES